MTNETKSIREQLREHQAATHCSDDRMVGILCDFIQKLDDDGQLEAPWDQWLFEFVVENLERGPMDIPVPAWQLPMFTDEDREAIVSSVMDELADESLKHRAHDALEDMPLVEVIGYVFPDDNDDLARMLQHLDNEDEDYVTGEFLRLHNDDGDDYDTMLDFAKRMGLINDDETELTELGREFVSINS